MNVIAPYLVGALGESCSFAVSLLLRGFLGQRQIVAVVVDHGLLDVVAGQRLHKGSAALCVADVFT